jgi:hypothetical protein
MVQYDLWLPSWAPPQRARRRAPPRQHARAVEPSFSHYSSGTSVQRHVLTLRRAMVRPLSSPPLLSAVLLLLLLLLPCSSAAAADHNHTLLVGARPRFQQPHTAAAGSPPLLSPRLRLLRTLVKGSSLGSGCDVQDPSPGAPSRWPPAAGRRCNTPAATRCFHCCVPVRGCATCLTGSRYARAAAIVAVVIRDPWTGRWHFYSVWGCHGRCGWAGQIRHWYSSTGDIETAVILDGGVALNHSSVRVDGGPPTPASASSPCLPVLG